MWVFVCYKKGSVSFDPSNIKFAQKFDDCTGRVINFIQQKTLQNWLKKSLKMGSVTMKNCILFTVVIPKLGVNYPLGVIGYNNFWGVMERCQKKMKNSGNQENILWYLALGLMLALSWYVKL